jgi:hypothetical protein
MTFSRGATTFENAESPFIEKFISSGVSLHNDLAGLDGGNSTQNRYYHLDEPAYNLVNTFADVVDVSPEGDLDIVGDYSGANALFSGNLTVGGTTSGITKTMVGLSNVDNTSDANKPISTATQNALNTKVDTSTNQTVAGTKTFSSSPIVPTPTAGTQVANKEYVDTKVSKDGTGASGTWGINITGNAASANALTSGDKTISGTLTLSGSDSYRGISLVNSSTSWAYQEYKSGTNIFHLAFSSVAQTGAPANSMHFRTNGATTQMYVAPSEVGVNTNLNVTGLVNLGSTQQASVQYNSTDNSIDFIIN